MKKDENRLGIDIGRVIIARDANPSKVDTSFMGSDMEGVLRTPPVHGAFEAISRLVRAFESRVWLVSKANPSTEEKTRAWLTHQGFFERTGVPTENLRFCRRRSEKADHCRELGITHFIDDRIEVLQALRGIVPHLYLFECADSLSEVFQRVRGWRETLDSILPTGSP